MERYEQCRQTVEEGLRQKIDLSREVSDEEVREMIDEMVIHCSRQYALSLKDRQQLGREIFDAIRRMDILQELVEEEEVTEIMINGTQGIFIERKGRLFQWDKNFASKEKLEGVIQQIVAKCNRAVNEASPIVDARTGKWSPREYRIGAGSFEWTNRNHTKVSVPSNRYDGSACIWLSYE